MRSPFGATTQEGRPMDVVHDGMADRAFTRALGEELRRAREHVGWSQSDLVARMPSRLHVKTLATYEQGIRQCTVVRLLEICRSLGVPAPDVLGRAMMHAEIDMQRVDLDVDLNALAADTRTELRPLRRWARNRLANNPVSGIARLDGSTIEEMAAIIGLHLSDLVRQLEMFTPRRAQHG
jgi:transcriptional regulator with XRE-family HTH domain